MRVNFFSSNFGVSFFKIHIIRKHLQVLAGSSHIIISSLIHSPESFLMFVKRKEKNLGNSTAGLPGEGSNWM